MSALKRNALITFAALAFSASAGATVIDFNGLGGTAVPGNNGYNPGYTSSTSTFTVSGYQFTSWQQYIFTPLWGAAFGGDAGQFTENGTDYLGVAGGVTMTSLTAPFSVASLDMQAWGGDMQMTDLLLTGVRAGDGTTVSTSITLNPTLNSAIQIGNDFTNYTLSGFTGLSSFTILGNAHGSLLSIDNIDVGVAAAAVPEPATLGMFGLGLAGLAAMRRRKQK
jgi:hypothetical protein